MFTSSMTELTIFCPSQFPLALFERPHLPQPEELSDETVGDDRDDNSEDDLDNMPRTDDADWEVFIPDELERDPLPEPGDFWLGDFWIEANVPWD